jgi:hypothetical protein
MGLRVMPGGGNLARREGHEWQHGTDRGADISTVYAVLDLAKK